MKSEPLKVYKQSTHGKIICNHLNGLMILFLIPLIYVYIYIYTYIYIHIYIYIYIYILLMDPYI